MARHGHHGHQECEDAQYTAYGWIVYLGSSNRAGVETRCMCVASDASSSVRYSSIFVGGERGRGQMCVVAGSEPRNSEMGTHRAAAAMCNDAAGARWAVGCLQVPVACGRALEPLASHRVGQLRTPSPGNVDPRACVRACLLAATSENSSTVHISLHLPPPGPLPSPPIVLCSGPLARPSVRSSLSPPSPACRLSPLIYNRFARLDKLLNIHL